MSEEKWRRLTNPQTAEDFGLSLTKEELGSFPAGRTILSEIGQLKQNKKVCSLQLRACGINAAKIMDSLILKSIGG